MDGRCGCCRERVICSIFFFQAEDGIRSLVRSRGLGNVYRRQSLHAAGVLGTLELTEDLRVALAGDVGEHVEPAAVLSLIHI